MASFARASRVTSALDLDPDEIASWVQRSPSKIARLDADRLGNGPVAALVAGLAEPDERRRTALCNEALHEIQALLSWADAAPGASLRLTMWATILAVALVVITRGDLKEQLVDLLGLGGGAAIAVLAARREADRYAASARASIDALVAAATRRASR